MKYYLDAKYDDKDRVKEKGGKWDTTKKKWYFTDKSKVDDFSEWLPPGYNPDDEVCEHDDILTLIESGKKKEDLYEELDKTPDEINRILYQLYQSKDIKLEDILTDTQYNTLKTSVENIINSGYEPYELDAMSRICRAERREINRATVLQERKEEVFNLAQVGMSVSEITEQVSFGQSAVEKHLLELIQEGLIPIEDYLSTSVETTILDAIKSIPEWNGRLKPVKEIISEDISYFEIRLTIYKNKLTE